MILAIGSLVGGLAVLSLGADALVRGSASLARRVGISPLIIGLTVVAIGTSLPELVVSLGAALRESGDMALGNIVGSNISNIALILGLSAVLRPMNVKAQVIRLDGPILVAASAALMAMLIDGRLDRVDGVLLVVGLLAYLAVSIRFARREPPAVVEEYDDGMPQQHALWTDALYVALGLAGLVGGAHFLVEGAVAIAASFGVSEVIVGLTIVAVGTSLPELATSLAAARRGEGDIAVGNAVGSSIFNILGILGATVIVHPLSTGSLSVIDGIVMTGLAVAVLPMMRTQFTLSRREGAILLSCYAAYLGSLVL
jgi:cation:H+ antiporter